MQQKQFEKPTLGQFLRAAQEFRLDVNDDNQVDALARQFFGNDPRAIDSAREVYARHTIGAANQTGLVFTDGPFTWMTDSLISDVTYGGNALMQWLPTEPMEPTREETVSHLSWVAPTGWQPQTQSYSAYLDDLEPEIPDACDPTCITGDWAAFDYNVKYGEVCTGSGKLTKDHFGIVQHRNVAIPAIRGPRAGMNMSTDADWARARAAIVMEMHLDWNLLYGVQGGWSQWDGLYELMTPGYVASHFVGNGAPHWAEPLVLDGSVATGCDQILALVKNTIRFLRRRIRQHQYRVLPMDMAIVLPAAIWARLADCIACGGDTGCGTQPTGYTKADWRAERDRTTTGGLGYGVMEIDEQFVPVIPLEGIAVGGVNGDGDNVVVGDIFVLTRRVNGMNAIAQQYFDWGQIDGFLEATYNTVLGQGGIIKETWLSENDECFSYKETVRGRNVIRMYPLQARIASVSVVVDLPAELELETAFLNEYFYGAADSGVLTPVGGTWS